MFNISENEATYKGIKETMKEVKQCRDLVERILGNEKWNQDRTFEEKVSMERCAVTVLCYIDIAENIAKRYSNIFKRMWEDAWVLKNKAKRLQRYLNEIYEVLEELQKIYNKVPQQTVLPL